NGAALPPRVPYGQAQMQNFGQANVPPNGAPHRMNWNEQILLANQMIHMNQPQVSQIAQLGSQNNQVMARPLRGAQIREGINASVDRHAQHGYMGQAPSNGQSP